MNGFDLVILALLGAAVVTAIRHLYKQRRRGCHGCCGSCSGCGKKE